MTKIMDEDRYVTIEEAMELARGEELPSAIERLLIYDHAKRKCFWMRAVLQKGVVTVYKLRQAPLQSSMLHGARSGIDHFKPLYPRPLKVEPEICSGKSERVARRLKRTDIYAKKRRSAS